MKFIFLDQHLQEFKNMPQLGLWKNKQATPWTRSVGLDDLGHEATSEPLSRSMLKKISGSSSAADRDVLWAILAWGGMRRDAARRLLVNETLWCNVVGRMRNEDLSRESCYKICSEAASSVPAGGIGPAFFTKLVFFANPKHDGYIMDQWTARSINFLIDGPSVVKMRTKNHVHPKNTPETYERFCLAIEQLSTHFPESDSEEIEQYLFSTGGRKPACWRRYLVGRDG